MPDILYILILALALSLDAFVCALAYGSGRIRMPLASVIVIAVVCSAVLAASMWLGVQILSVISPGLAMWLGFAILFGLGLLRLLDGWVKRFLRQRAGLHKQLRFNAFGLSFMLHLLADPAKADMDESKTLSTGEAAVLAVSLSLDSLAIGISAAFAGVYMVYLVTLSFAATVLALFMGLAVGARLSRCLPVDISSAGGALLILLAIGRLIL
ncbi:MAG: manganese efflux pump [Defluviitaleaceae bacterium]|nr:manganese efflux pump [Defluviitaleaceae bacterium]